MESPLTFLKGPRIYLRALMEEDINGPYISWFNDTEICRGNSHHLFPYTKQLALKYLETLSKSSDELVFAIVLNDGDRHIGNISLQHIHPINRSSELSIIIGEKSSWGKGYASEAAGLLISHAFLSLNLRRISCGTFETNISMQKLARSLGMTEEGRRRQAAFKDGKYIDIIEYGLLKSEFKPVLNE